MSKKEPERQLKKSIRNNFTLETKCLNNWHIKLWTCETDNWEIRFLSNMIRTIFNSGQLANTIIATYSSVLLFKILSSYPAESFQYTLLLLENFEQWARKIIFTHSSIILKNVMQLASKIILKHCSVLLLKISAN